MSDTPAAPAPRMMDLSPDASGYVPSSIPYTAAPAPDVGAIMALADAVADGAIQSDAKEAAAKAALRAEVEQIVRSLSAWEQVWEGIRDNHEPNLNPTNKPLAVAAIFQLAINRVARAEADRDAVERVIRDKVQAEARTMKDVK